MAKKKKLKLKRLFRKKPHYKYWYAYYLKYAGLNDKVILLESFHGESINDSSLVFAREIQRLYPGEYKVYYATSHKEDHQAFVDATGLDVTLVDITSMKYMKVLATAKYIISNASLPIYYIRRPGQVYLQTWHGTPLKTLGKKMRMGIESMYNVQHNFLQASHLLFPNDFTRDAIMGDYNLEKLYTGKVIMAGYPRNQVFMQPGKGEELKKRLHLEDKTVYAYMPTWRGTSNRSVNITDYIVELEKILRELDERMRDDQVFYINFHTMLKSAVALEGYRHIRPFPADVDNYTFLNCADALVTDYSSVFFDYSLTGKPIILFMYDYDQYMHDRGLYMDIRELPFRQIFDTDEFCDCIAGDKCLKDRYDDTDYYREFTRYDAPDNTEKLLKIVLEDEETDLKVIDYSFNKDRKLKVFLPKKANRDSDFRTLAKVASDDDSVVLLYRKWFKGDVSQLLHDKYNDSFNYVITTKTPPRTYLEQALSNKKVERARDAIHQRDLERCFPGLDIEAELVDYGYIEDGFQVALEDMVPIEAQPAFSKDAVMTVWYTSPGEGYDLKEAVIFDGKYTLIHRRPLTEEEKKDCRVEYDFTEVIESWQTYFKERARVGILCTDPAGDTKIISFTDTRKYQRAIPFLEKGSVSGTMYTPAAGTYMLPEDYFNRKFIRTVRSYDEEVNARVSTFNMEKVPTRVVLLPYLERGTDLHLLTVRLCDQMNTMSYYGNSGVLKSYRVKGNTIVMTVLAPYWDENLLVGAKLIFDSKVEDIEIPMDFTKKAVSGGVLMTLSLDLTRELPLKSLRWHCRIVTRLGGSEYFLRIRNFSNKNEMKLRLSNLVCEDGRGMVMFPYIGKRSIVKFMYREITEDDNAEIRRREVEAMALYKTVGKVLRRKKFYLIYEKFCKTAQDNSYYFFKYCMENLPEEDRKRFFYVIDKNSPDYQVIKEYDDQIIQFMSVKHMLYAMCCRMLISTDSVTHLYTWSTRPSYVEQRIRKKGVLFLQHGVTALKRVDHLFGKRGSSPMKYFVVTSDIEQQIVVDEFGYKEDRVPVVGFARWDVLENKEDLNDRFILIMPTWRSWLENADDEEFANSEYYHNYSALLKDPRLRKILEEKDLRVVLYLHPKFAQFIDTFRDEISDRIECVPFGEKPLNDIMMRCAMLVTDYSSVCWDVLYMDKPVVFYQFDGDMYQAVHGSYIDLKTELPCPRTEEIDDVVSYIGEYAENGFCLQPEYKEKSDRYFKYRDDQNSKRTFDFLMFKEEGRNV